MSFVYPWNLALIPLLVPLYLAACFFLSRRGEVRLSTLSRLSGLGPNWRLRFRWLPTVLGALCLSLFLFALARPQMGLVETRVESEGVDIMLAVDVSGSMMAEDFVVNGQRQNRLDAVKLVVRDFIEKRPTDRIGLVVFAGRSYLQCPLTLDHAVLLKFLERLQIGMLEDGTAVGDGLATALGSLKKLKARSKIVILLTDGVNNAGKIEPQSAAELARALEIKVYTIGAGSKGRVPYPVQDMFGNKVYQWAVIDLDDEALMKIAETTRGRYWRATATEELKGIYAEIDRLEKTKVETNLYTEYQELFVPFVLGGLLLLLLKILLEGTVWRTLP